MAQRRRKIARGNWFIGADVEIFRSVVAGKCIEIKVIAMQREEFDKFLWSLPVSERVAMLICSVVERDQKRFARPLPCSTC